MSDDVTPLEQTGFAAATVKEDGGEYRFALDEYGALHEAWTGGRSFFTGRSAYADSEVSVKLALIEGVTRWTAVALAALRAEIEAKQARERQRDMLGGES